MLILVPLFVAALAPAATPSAPPPPSANPALLAGYFQMYDLAFDKAHRTFLDFEQNNPADPLGPASNAAAYLFHEFERLHILQSELFVDDSAFKHRKKPDPDPNARRAFDAELDKSSRLASAILAHSPNDSNALFATLLGYGLRADYDALVDKHYLSSLDNLKAGRTLAQQLLAANPSCYDAYIAIGVENYLLSLKPAPLRWLLELGGAQADKDTGIANLRLTAEHGVYLKPYARLLLGIAALRDHDTATARRILLELSHQFPDNPLYSQELARLH